jgi:hypothetical protein
MNTHLLRTDAYAESLSDTTVAANDETYEQFATCAKELGYAVSATPTEAATTTLDSVTIGAVLSAAEAENDYYLGGYAGI